MGRNPGLGEGRAGRNRTGGEKRGGKGGGMFGKKVGKNGNGREKCKEREGIFERS